MKIIGIEEVLVRQEVFHHLDDDGTERHFDVSAMWRFLSALAGFSTNLLPNDDVEALDRVAMDDEFIARIKREPERIDPRKLAALKEPYLSLPVLAVFWYNGSTLVVDGSHRLVKWHARGDQDYRMLRFKPGRWERFLLSDEDLARIRRMVVRGNI